MIGTSEKFSLRPEQNSWSEAQIRGISRVRALFVPSVEEGICFRRGSQDSGYSATLWIRNQDQTSLQFCMKTTHPKMFVVKPTTGSLSKWESATVQIIFVEPPPATTDTSSAEGLAINSIEQHKIAVSIQFARENLEKPTHQPAMYKFKVNSRSLQLKKAS